MWEQVETGGEPPTTPAETPEPPPKRGSSTGVVVAAILAVAASAGLGWWVASPQPAEPPPPTQVSPAAQATARVEPPALLRYASAEPVPAQVRQAYDEARAVYVDGGPEALVRASESCAEKLQQDPRTLDECLAFDVYAGDILPARGAHADEAAWFHDGDARAVALARSALPGHVDAADRVAQVRALTTAVLPRPAKPRPPAVRRVSVRRAAVAGRLHKASRVVPARPRKPLAGPRTVSEACRDEPSLADKLVCADKALAERDRKMRTAYDLAIASGVDPASLAQDQADWRESRDSAGSRDAVDRLYRQRIQDLEALTPPH